MGISDANNVLKKGLTEAARIWVGEARKTGYTRAIRKGFKVGKAIVANAGGMITISNSAPEMGAYEFGSGLHATHGPRRKYLITPKNAPNLAFSVKRWNPAFIPPISQKFRGIWNKKYVFRYVEHPGVAPHPVMKPALLRKHDEMRNVIGKTFSVEFLYKDIREAWHGGNK